MTARGQMGPGSEGVWIAHYSDGSGFVPFLSEIAALRYALDYSMHVTFVPYGVDVLEAERAQREARA